MSVLLKVFRSLPKLLIASLAFCVGVTKTSAAGGHGGGGHGGGAGHVAGFHGGPGFHGGRGYYGGYGYYGYPYGFYGFGLGLGLGYGLGYGYGYPYYGYGYPYYGGGYYYGGHPYYSYPYYGAPYVAGYPLVTNPAPGTTPPNGTTSPGVTTTSSDGGTPPDPLPAGLAGQIPTLPGRFSDSELALIVRVPADATVWVNGAKTTQKGMRREFNSTGLEPGRSYTFHVRAQWTEANGKVVETDRRITVQAGERRSLDFMSVPALPTAVTSAPTVAKP